MICSSRSINSSHHGVAFVINKEITKYIKDYETINDRIIKLTRNYKPSNLQIIQTYIATHDADDNKINKIYQKLEIMLGKIPSQEIMIIMEDLNTMIRFY